MGAWHISVEGMGNKHTWGSVLKDRPTYLKVTQCPMEPVVANSGLAIMAETVLAAVGELGS